MLTIEYVHAKLMIIDDRVVIIGSSNINDRSMLGMHHSELGLIVHGGQMIESTMAGEPFTVSKFAHEMRKRLWKDYLGLEQTDESIADPISDVAYKKWTNTASNNVKIYKKVFRNLPDNILCVDGKVAKMLISCRHAECDESRICR